jgi:hypothetical protein
MLGMAAGYYFWIIHRIGTKSTTRFTIALAAKELEVNRRTIERWDKVLTKLGFISIKHRSHAGLRTYSEYTANPINKIIGDDGRATTRLSQPATTRVSQESGPRSGTAVVPSPSSLLSEGAKQTEAGRALPAATADFVTKGEDMQHQPSALDREIINWIEQHAAEIANLGFKYRKPTSLLTDMRKFFAGDEEFFSMFVDQWPLLLIKLQNNQFLRKARCDLGFGWLFQGSKQNPGETNYQVILCSQTYDDVRLPGVVYKPGHRLLYRSNRWEEGRELFPNAVDGRDNLSGDSFSVDEHDAVDQVF